MKLYIYTISEARNIILFTLHYTIHVVLSPLPLFLKLKLLHYLHYTIHTIHTTLFTLVELLRVTPPMWVELL